MWSTLCRCLKFGSDEFDSGGGSSVLCGDSGQWFHILGEPTVLQALLDSSASPPKKCLI